MAVNRTMEQLDAAIAADGCNYDLFIERGILFNKMGDPGNALNNFLRAREIDSERSEAHEYILMLNEILEFRHNDLLNP